MKRFPRAIALAFITCILMGAADGKWLNRVPAADRAKTNPLPDQKIAAEAGSHLYATECSHCHGQQAQGKGGRPALISDRIKTATDGDLAWLLRNGNTWKGMPSWSSLPDDERWQLVAYMRSLNEPGGAPEAKNLADSKKIEGAAK